VVIKIGDKVECIEQHDGKSCIVGKFGTVVVKRAGSKWGVEFKEDIGGHSLGRVCEHGYGWDIPEYKLKKKSKRQVINKGGKLVFLE